MSEQFLERCTVCRGDLYYKAADSFVTCPACGGTQAVALFQREKNRLQQALSEKALAQAELETVLREKQSVQEKLNLALSTLSQADMSHEQITSLASQLGENRQAFETMINGLQNGQSVLLQALRGPGGTQEKLQDLQNKVQFLLDMNLGNTQLFRQIHAAATTLLNSWQRYDEKIDKLQSTANATQKTLDTFFDAWKQEKLNKLSALYQQAENFRSDRAFDKAENAYRELQTEGAEYAKDPEILWRTLLSHYGVEYIYSGAVGGYVPTIYRPDLTDPAQMSLRKELFACCDDRQKAYYQRNLSKIDEILQKYRRLRADTHYDVFLSVKQSVDGRYTADSEKANALCDQLTGWGLKVFNSRRATIPAEQEFEPLIIAALMSAKVMIVVGTTPEYINSAWVRNEWMRFQWLQTNEKNHSGKTDRVLLCYLANGMRANRLPIGLNPNLQAIIEDSSAGEKLFSTLKGIFPLLQQSKAKSSEPAAPAEAVKEDSSEALNQMKVWLSLGRYKLVTNKYEELLTKGKLLNNSHLYLYALCAAHKVPDIDALIESDLDLSSATLFQTAAKICSDQALFDDLLSRNQAWREEKRRLQEEEERKRLEEIERSQKEQEDIMRRETEAAREQNEEREKRKHFKADAESIKKVFQYNGSISGIYITRYTGDDSTAVIPISIDDVSVTSIGYNAFSYTRVKEAILPDTIRTIGAKAFYRSTCLEKIDFSRNLQYIGDDAFNTCAKLTTVHLPEGLEHINDAAFANCRSLQSVYLPSSVTSIGKGAFSNCPDLTLYVKKGSYAQKYARWHFLKAATY